MSQITFDPQAAQPRASSPNPSRVGATHYGLLAAAWLMLLIYGSLAPFHFKKGLPSLGNGPIAWLYYWSHQPQWDWRLHNDYSSLGINNAFNDLAINLMLYIPLGVLLRLAAWRRGWRWSVQVAATAAVIAAVSWAIECTQGITSDRIASYKDVCVNTLGGLLGVMIGVGLRRTGNWLVFAVYRRVSYWLYHARQFILRHRRRPAVMAGAIVLDAALLGWVFARFLVFPNRKAPQVNWIPFANQFARSYDVASVQIGRWLLVYLLLAMLLTLQFFTSSTRRSMGYIVLGAALLAALREAWQFFTPGARVDLTGPVVAVFAAGTLLVAIFLLRDAVRESCRRRNQAPVAFERRRMPHTYEGGPASDRRG